MLSGFGLVGPRVLFLAVNEKELGRFVHSFVDLKLVIQ
jgi:hypothetical protein